MSKRYQFQNRTAVVTGAASGIGAALAAALVERGCHVALMDVNGDGLQTVADDLASGDRRVTTRVFDIGDRDEIYRFAEDVSQQHGGADLLFNNAGVGVMGKFEQVSEEDFDWLLGINLFGPIRMIRAFLPLLHQSEDAHITNVSSIFGVISPPGQTAYSASKFGLRGFSDALRHEFEGTSIGVTTVHPGGIDTNISASSRVPAKAKDEDVQRVRSKVKELLVMPPPRAAKIILKAVEKRRPRVLVGGDAKRMEFFQRLLPGRYWSVMKLGRDVSEMELTDV